MVKQSAGGKIINIGSLSPRHPSVVAMAAYDASKAGINGLTKNFALEMAPHQVAVNEIVPGRIRTPGVAGAEEATGMRAEQAKARTAQAADEIPLKRWGSADNVATVAIFLASSAADYMTGEVVVVDGGLLLT
jgi:NAD(P)-dependent dehydrogenase (short-subunit alcohol dehydrogenase family)